MAVVTKTDRPKSVCNSCVIEGFGGVFVLYLDFFLMVYIYGVCHRIESDLFPFLLLSKVTNGHGTVSLLRIKYVNTAIDIVRDFKRVSVEVRCALTTICYFCVSLIESFRTFALCTRYQNIFSYN